MAASGSEAGGRTLDDLRRAAHATGAGVRLGGQPAANADFVDAVYGSFPLMIALITVTTSILLARAFRSLLLPLKAIVLNVLSIAAAWGTDLKMFATGLGAGILLDATVIRALIVPAVIAVMGRWNWWLPAWPARLLRVDPSLPRQATAGEG